jgi:hypothetical protein
MPRSPFTFRDLSIALVSWPCVLGRVFPVFLCKVDRRLIAEDGRRSLDLMFREVMYFR